MGGFFQFAHDLANEYFNCYMTNTRAFTHNMSRDTFYCFLYCKNGNPIDFEHKLNTFKEFLILL